MRKAESLNISASQDDLAKVTSLEPAERDVLSLLSTFELKLREAAREYSPAVIANYAFDLAKEYNKFYQNIPIFSETDPFKLKFMVALSEAIANAIRRAMGLLGITVPDKM